MRSSGEQGDLSGAWTGGDRDGTGISGGDTIHGQGIYHVSAQD